MVQPSESWLHRNKYQGYKKVSSVCVLVAQRNILIYLSLMFHLLNFSLYGQVSALADG